MQSNGEGPSVASSTDTAPLVSPSDAVAVPEVSAGAAEAGQTMTLRELAASKLEGAQRARQQRKMMALLAANDAATPRVGSSAPRYAPRVLRDFDSHVAARVRAADLSAIGGAVDAPDASGLATILAFDIDDAGAFLAAAGPGVLAIFRLDAFGPAGLVSRDGPEPSGGSKPAGLLNGAVLHALDAPVTSSANVVISANGKAAVVMEGEGATQVSGVPA